MLVHPTSHCSRVRGAARTPAALPHVPAVWNRFHPSGPKHAKRGPACFSESATASATFVTSGSGSFNSFEEPYRPSPADPGEVSLEHEVARLVRLMQQLAACRSIPDKVALLDAHHDVLSLRAASPHRPLWPALDALPLEQQLVLKLLPAIGQAHVLALAPSDGAWGPSLARLAEDLLRVETFYDCLGGLVGYQVKSLQLILEKQAEVDCGGGAAAGAAPSNSPEAGEQLTYHVPPGLDLAGEAGRQLGVSAAAQGLLALPAMAEILPVGGAGDRLGLLCDKSGEALPAAMLPYTGRPIMEWLLRDLQAREYLYWHLTGTQVTTPVAIMTSDAKGNHQRIQDLLDSLGWLGRDPESFRLFRQPLVPVVDSATGSWLLTSPLRVMRKPGGHGAIWKLMLDEGVFDWLAAKGRGSALVRQISNPMAGTDTTLLALAGTGFSGRRAFGFMSCERVVGAAEGMNVLQERRTWAPDASHPEGGSWRYRHAITNVEYTEFERLGICDQAVDESSEHSVFPANTNILYVGLNAARATVAAAAAAGSADVLPNLIFNLKKKVKYFDPLLQAEREVRAGRMECTMQNLADSMADESDASVSPQEGGGATALARNMSTFMVYNLRRKVTSSAKKARAPGSTRIHQTPDGSFFDLMRNAWHLLQRCGLRHVPEVGDVSTYLASGPGFIFLYHPALGPLWDVIAQKVRGGAIMDGSEVVLEVAEARLVDVTVDGSLQVLAERVLGHDTGADDAAAAPAPGGNGLIGVGGTDGYGAFAGGAVQGTGLVAAADTVAEAAAAAAVAAGRPTALPASARGRGQRASPGRSGGAGAAPPASATGRVSPAPRRLCYSSRCGRVHLLNVTVQNVGVDWHHPGNVYWRHQVQRHESCRVILRGRSEFEAYDCRISGDRVFDVPDGCRMVVTAAPSGGGLLTTLHPLPGGAPSWEWRYMMDTGGAVSLEFVRNAALGPRGAATAATAALGGTLSWTPGLGGALGGFDELDGEPVLDFVI